MDFIVSLPFIGCKDLEILNFFRSSSLFYIFKKKFSCSVILIVLVTFKTFSLGLCKSFPSLGMFGRYESKILFQRCVVATKFTVSVGLFCQ